jgi:hypothetical protein
LAIGTQAHAPSKEGSSVHGFKNFSRIAHHTTTLDSFELPDTETLLEVGWQIEPSADVSCLFGKSSVSMNVYSLWKCVKLRNLGQVLHQVPNGVFGDDTLSHAMRPPSLLVKLW